MHNGRLKSSGINHTRLLQPDRSRNAVDSGPTPEITLPAFIADEYLYHDSDSHREFEYSKAIQPSDNAGLETPSPHTEVNNSDANSSVGAASSANRVSSFELRWLLEKAENIVHDAHGRKSMRARTAATITA